MIQLKGNIWICYLETILSFTATGPVLKSQHEQARRELLRRKKSDKNQAIVKAAYIRHLGATDFALRAAIFCSLANGVQKLEIFSE